MAEHSRAGLDIFRRCETKSTSRQRVTRAGAIAVVLASTLPLGSSGGPPDSAEILQLREFADAKYIPEPDQQSEFVQNGAETIQLKYDNLSVYQGIEDGLKDEWSRIGIDTDYSNDQFTTEIDGETYIAHVYEWPKGIQSALAAVRGEADASDFNIILEFQYVEDSEE